MITGAVSGTVTLIFFMAILGASIFGLTIPKDSRNLIIIVLSLGLGLSASFLGGAATLEGRIPLPFAQARPLQFATSGGVAVVFISSLLGYWLYSPAETRSIEQDMRIIEDAGRTPKERINALLELRDGYQLKDWHGRNLSGLSLPASGWKGLNLREANLVGVIWDHADLQGVDLVRAQLRDAHLRSADFRGGALNGAVMQGADCTRANFHGVWLRAGKFTKANFSEADLSEANLQFADFTDAVFDDADLSDANFADDNGSDVARASFRRANIRGTDFRNARGLDTAHLEGAVFSSTTAFPSSFKKEGHDMVEAALIIDMHRAPRSSTHVSRSQ